MTAVAQVAFPIHTGRSSRVALPRDAGGKAHGLVRIADAGLRTAPWFVIPNSCRPADASSVPASLARSVANACDLLRAQGATAFAVRSSALDEDGTSHSFAGQYETVLGVSDPEDVLDSISRCWASADAPSVATYRVAAGLPAESPGIAVVVQAMVEPAWSGVAFSRCPAPDDVSGDAVVVATRGPGAPLVSGEVDGDEYRVRADGTVEVRRVDPVGNSGNPGDGVPRLDFARVREVAEAARRLERLDGRPQDVEWAITTAAELCLLQTRPITAGMSDVHRRPGSRSRAAPIPGPAFGATSDGGDPIRADGDTIRAWDNANIVESFPGVTLPLTYSIAREAYAAVYHGACRALGVPAATLDANAQVFDQMIGHVDGRVYYNVSSWHRVLSLLPGFGTNREFLERMMGARRPGGGTGERAASVAAASHDVLDLLRVAVRVGVGLLLFERRARAFERSIRGLGRDVRGRDLDSLSIDGLLACYEEVRARALRQWHVTIFNDLAVMVVHGALRRAAERWLGRDADRVVNGLLRAGGLASTAPAEEIRAIAARLREEASWREALDAADDPLGTLHDDPSLDGLRRLFEAYLERWGDRCPRELQLDQPTFREEPGPLLSVVRGLASAPDGAAIEDPLRGGVSASRSGSGDARSVLEAVLEATPPVQRLIHRCVLRSLAAMTRNRLAWRERMRFARTDVFAVARGIFRSMDRQCVATGLLARPGDLHYLDITEIRGAVRGTLPPVDLKALVSNRRALFTRVDAVPAPPSRFETVGAVALAPRQPSGAPAAQAAASARIDLVGTPVWAGVVRGACLAIDDPRSVAPVRGSIVVARSTDPGWVPLLLSAGGLLVERGSVLSHSAIVARELGLPTIVGIDGLMAAVAPGAVAEMDGTTGHVGVIPAETVR